MKRFASHYLLIPEIGFIKQQVVEINDEGVVQNIFPLTEEIESVEWMPGVIVLFPVSRMEEIAANQPSHCLGKVDEFQRQEEALLPYLFYPFDFISMQPVDGTRHRLLR